MPKLLYLDTARLGQMSPRARSLHLHFVRLASEEAGSLYFDDFLRHGFESWPPCLKRRYCGLALWQGVSDLKRRLKHLAGAKDDSKVLLANRSAELMGFAARQLFDRCENVLVTDLSWPSYAEILKSQAKQSEKRLTAIPVRTAIQYGHMRAAELVRHLANAFIAHHCDGLVLPAVDNCGIRLPLRELVTELRRRAELRFVVIDGAQAFCHVPTNLAEDYCDLYLAGCHKWLRAAHPMGLAFLGHPRTQADIEEKLAEEIAAGGIHDPLLKFCEELEGAPATPFGETVNLSSLFSCRGAVEDIAGEGREGRFLTQLENFYQLARLAQACGWLALQPEPNLRSGILLLQAEDRRIRALDAGMLRRRLIELEVAATTYDWGKVRLALPVRPFRAIEISLLRSALTNAATWLTDELPPSPVPCISESLPTLLTIQLPDTILLGKSNP